MSSPSLPKTGKTKLDRLRNILKRKTSHPSSQHSIVETSINSDALGPEQDASHDDDLSAHSTISGPNSQNVTNALISSKTRPFSQQQQSFDSDSEPKTKTSDKLKRRLGVARNGLETALRLLERSADVFPPLKSAVGGLVAFLDLGEAVTENDEEYEKIAAELTSIAENLTQHVPKLAVDGVSSSVGRIVELINTESTQIKQQQDRNRMVRTITAFQDQGDVIQRYRRIESLFRQLQSDMSLRNWDDMRKMRETGLLKDMSPVYEAQYNSGYSMTVNRRGCTAETREKVLEDLKAWVDDSKGAKVYWMNGMAGTGKTTISYSLCEWLRDNSQLGGNYFCSRASALCRNIDNIIPTLAHQLAQYSYSFRSSLCNVLEEEPGVCKLDVQWQFKKLIQKPLQVINTAIPENVVVVIDALDECDDGSAFRLFLDTLLGLADIEESIVSTDIRKYLTEALGSMSPVPSTHHVEQLVKCAGKLFIYAATVVRYICPGDPDVDCKTLLQTALRMVSRSTNQYDDLSELYTNILRKALYPPNKRRVEEERNNILLVLKTVVCAMEPMNTQTLASLLSLTEDQVRFSLQPLRSVLHMGEKGEEPVVPFHGSFPDFLFDSPKSEDALQFHCETTMDNECRKNPFWPVRSNGLTGSSFA